MSLSAGSTAISLIHPSSRFQLVVPGARLSDAMSSCGGYRDGSNSVDVPIETGDRLVSGSLPCVNPAGFDVLCVTDHVLRRDDPWPLRHGRPCLDATNVGAYLAEIER